MASFKVTADTNAIREELYPLVKESLNKSITRTKYKKIVNDFIANMILFHVIELSVLKQRWIRSLLL